MQLLLTRQWVVLLRSLVGVLVWPLYPDLLAIKGSKFYFGCGLWIELHRLQLGDTSLLQHLNENKYQFYEGE